MIKRSAHWYVILVVAAVVLASACSSPLVRAAKKGSADEVRALVSGDRKHCGEALREAASRNREEAIKALLDGGCDVNAKDKDGYTPLMMAAIGGHDNSARLLLMRKANVDLITWHDKTAAMLARDNRHRETATLIETLDRIANPEVAKMVAAGQGAGGGGGFLDSVLDAAVSGAAQSMIQQAASGKMPDMNTVAQGALRGALNGEAAGPSQGLLNAAAGGALGGAAQNLGKNPQSMLRAATTGAAVEAAGNLLTGSSAMRIEEPEPSAPTAAAAETVPPTQPRAAPAPVRLLDAPADLPSPGKAPTKQKSGPFRYEFGQSGLDELVGLIRLCAEKNMAWNLPWALGDAVRAQVKIGDLVGPALYYNGLDLETTPPGRIERWTETRAGGRSFFMYWLVNPLGDRADDRSGTVAYLETDMPLPLRRRLFVVTQYLGPKTFDSAYGEQMTVPHLKVIAAAATNDRYSVDGSDLPEFYFDDRSIAKLEKRLKPHQDAAASVAKANVEATPGAGPKSVAPDRSKDCAALTKILASKDDIAAQHGAQRAAQVMVAARKRFEEYECR